MFKNFEQEFVINEDPKIRITAKLSRTVSFEFNYIDQNTGQILIKNKAKLDTKGKKFESLISCGIFGDYNHFEQSLQKKINIIENGSITFKVLLNTIIIKIVVEDKRIKKNAYGAASARELTIIIILKIQTIMIIILHHLVFNKEKEHKLHILRDMALEIIQE